MREGADDEQPRAGRKKSMELEVCGSLFMFGSEGGPAPTMPGLPIMPTMPTMPTMPGLGNIMGNMGMPIMAN